MLSEHGSRAALVDHATTSTKRTVGQNRVVPRCAGSHPVLQHHQFGSHTRRTSQIFVYLLRSRSIPGLTLPTLGAVGQVVYAFRHQPVVYDGHHQRNLWRRLHLGVLLPDVTSTVRLLTRWRGTPYWVLLRLVFISVPHAMCSVLDCGHTQPSSDLPYPAAPSLSTHYDKVWTNWETTTSGDSRLPIGTWRRGISDHDVPYTASRTLHCPGLQPSSNVRRSHPNSRYRAVFCRTLFVWRSRHAIHLAPSTCLGRTAFHSWRTVDDSQRTTPSTAHGECRRWLDARDSMCPHSLATCFHCGSAKPRRGRSKG